MLRKIRVSGQSALPHASELVEEVLGQEFLGTPAELQSHSTFSARAFQIFQHLFRVPLGFYIVEYVRNFPVRPNNESRPRNSFHLPAIHIFFFDHAEEFADFLLGICQ